MKNKPAEKAPKRAKVAAAPKPASTFTEVANIPFRKALVAAGGYPELATALGVSRQAVYKWGAIPDRFAPTVEKLYGISRKEIAPHLYE